MKKLPPEIVVPVVIVAFLGVALFLSSLHEKRVEVNYKKKVLAIEGEDRSDQGVVFSKKAGNPHLSIVNITNEIRRIKILDHVEREDGSNRTEVEIITLDPNESRWCDAYYEDSRKRPIRRDFYVLNKNGVEMDFFCPPKIR